MSGLSEADRALIYREVPINGWDAESDVYEAVEQIITRHVREALNAAAEEVGFWEANAQRVTTSGADAETVRNAQARQSAYRRAGAIIRAHADAP